MQSRKQIRVGVQMTKFCHGCKCEEVPKASVAVSYDCPCYCCTQGHTDLCPKWLWLWPKI